MPTGRTRQCADIKPPDVAGILIGCTETGRNAHYILKVFYSWPAILANGFFLGNGIAESGYEQEKTLCVEHEF
jgi:hypothetical protein